MVHSLLRSHQRCSNLLSTTQLATALLIKCQTPQTTPTPEVSDLSSVSDNLINQSHSNQILHLSNQQLLTNIGNNISPRCAIQSVRFSSVRFDEEVQLKGISSGDSSLNFCDDGDSLRSRAIASDSYGVGESLRAYSTPTDDDSDKEDQEDLEKALEEFAEIGDEDEDEEDDEDDDYDDDDDSEDHEETLEEYSKTEK